MPPRKRSEAREAEVDTRTAPKTRPELGQESGVLKVDYTAYLPAPLELTDTVKNQQITDVFYTALNRGLKPTGVAELVETEKVDENNYRLVYSIPVEASHENPEDAPAAPSNEPAADEKKD